LGGGEPL